MYTELLASGLKFVMQVAVPAFDLPPYIMHEGNTLTGVVPELLEDVKARYFKTVSFNITKVASYNFDGCAHDAALGVYDFCLAPTWILPSRMKFATFSQPMSQDKFHLVAKQTNSRADKDFLA